MRQQKKSPLRKHFRKRTGIVHLVTATASAAVVVIVATAAVIGENKNEDYEKDPIVVVSEEHPLTSFRTFQ